MSLNYLNAHVIAVLLNKKNMRTVVDCSSGMKDVVMIEAAAIESEDANKMRRFIRFSSGRAINMPGISAATTKMKLNTHTAIENVILEHLLNIKKITLCSD